MTKTFGYALIALVMTAAGCAYVCKVPGVGSLPGITCPSPTATSPPMR